MSNGGDNPADAEVRDRLVATARGWLGTPYVHQASARGIGCDCLGLIRGVWREVLGEEPIGLPAYSPDWGEAGRRESVLEAARSHLAEIAREEAGAGDVLVFRWRPGTIAKHLGILTGPSRFIHAWEVCGVVEVALIDSWRRRIAAAFRFPARSPTGR